MKYILSLILLISLTGDIDRIAKINQIKKQAKEAFVKGNYQAAIDKYNYLLDSMNVDDYNIRLNLGNAYYQLKDTTNATNTYNELTSSPDKLIKSVAHQQLGVMANKTKKFEEALNHFKSAIKADPTNEDARYNYELLKKVLDEQKKNQDQNDQNDQNKDQKKDQNKDKQQQNKENQSDKNEQKDQQNQDKKENKEDQQDKEGQSEEEKEQQQKEEQSEKGEEDKKEQQKPENGKEEKNDDQMSEEDMKSFSKKLEEMNISEDKAKMILEAMKNNEIQYLQQKKKTSQKKRDLSKPDW